MNISSMTFTVNHKVALYFSYGLARCCIEVVKTLKIKLLNLKKQSERLFVVALGDRNKDNLYLSKLE